MRSALCEAGVNIFGRPSKRDSMLLTLTAELDAAPAAAVGSGRSAASEKRRHRFSS
jgi:hypothetical protein